MHLGYHARRSPLSSCGEANHSATALAFVAVLASCAGGAPQTSGPQDLAITLLEQGISEANPGAIAPLINSDYRQHNPRVADGPAGLLNGR